MLIDPRKIHSDCVCLKCNHNCNRPNTLDYFIYDYVLTTNYCDVLKQDVEWSMKECDCFNINQNKHNPLWYPVRDYSHQKRLDDFL